MSNHERRAAPFVFEAAGLIKEYDEGRVHALRGVDFQISDGEFVAIVGPSGSGKTTLLQMLGALDRPSAGTLSYRGESLPDLTDDATISKRLEREFQPLFISCSRERRGEAFCVDYNAANAAIEFIARPYAGQFF